MGTQAMYRGRKIITNYDRPPIPSRSCDWFAVFDGYDGASDSNDPVGYGVSENAAIQDLIRQIED